MAGAKITEVTDETFQTDVLNSALPVLVDFWASWCGPCKALVPTIEQIATEYDGKLKVMKLDVDLNEAMARRFEIRGIPALLLFRDGKEARRIVGFVSKEIIDKSVLQVLA